MAIRRGSPGSSLGPDGLPDPRSRRVLPSDHQSGGVRTSAHCCTERSFWYDADGYADRHDATHIELSARSTSGPWDSLRRVKPAGRVTRPVPFAGGPLALPVPANAGPQADEEPDRAEAGQHDDGHVYGGDPADLVALHDVDPDRHHETLEAAARADLQAALCWWTPLCAPCAGPMPG